MFALRDQFSTSAQKSGRDLLEQAVVAGELLIEVFEIGHFFELQIFRV